MVRISLYLSLAGFVGALRPQDYSAEEAGTQVSRDLFGFVDAEHDSGPYGHAHRDSYAAGSVAPFWTFRTNNEFVYDSSGWYRRMRDSSSEDEMEMAGTELVSEQETGRDVPTRPKHGVPGEWAKGEVPGREEKVELGFVPVQIYSQSRRYDSEEHLPQERAVEEADGQEEVLAAPRLREVLRNKKLHEVYEEEGYEDLGYDHGGYNHHGVKVEKAVKKEDGLYRKTPPPGTDSLPEGSQPTGEQQVESRIVNTVHNAQPAENGQKEAAGAAPSKEAGSKESGSSGIADRMDIAASQTEEGLEPRVMSRHKSRVVFPGRSTRRQYTSSLISPIVVAPDVPYVATATVQNPQILHQVATFEPSPYYYDTSPASFSSTSPIQFASTINAYASLINQNISTPLLQSRQNTSDEYTLSRSDRKSQSESREGEAENHNAGLRGSQNPVPVKNHNSRQSGRRRGSSRGGSSSPNISTKGVDAGTKEFSASDSSISPSSNKKPPRNNSSYKKSKVYSNLTRGNAKYSPEDDSQWTPTIGTQNTRHPSMPIDSNESKTDVSARPFTKHDQQQTRIIATEGSGVSESEPTKDPSANAKYVEQLTLAHFSAPVYVNPTQTHLSSQDKRLSDLAKQLNAPHFVQKEQMSQRKRRDVERYSREKYPHYTAPKSISKDSPLKYATNSEDVPKKTYGGMEFYESKENIKCNGPIPPKNVTPEKEEEGEWEEDPMPKEERVKGVGDAIDCFKTKYFGKDPLDNPFFKEREVYSEDVSYKSDVEEKPPIATSATEPDNRKIMFILNPEFLRNNSDLESGKRSINSEEESTESNGSSEDMSIATRRPYYSHNSRPQYSSNQYSAYESEEAPRITKSEEAPRIIKSEEAPRIIKSEPHRTNKINHPKDENKSTYILKEKEKPQSKYVMYPVSVYSIISTDNIPPHHAPLLIPETGHKFAPIPIKKDHSARHPEIHKDPQPPKFIRPPPQYENKIVVMKRDGNDNFWSMMNPLNWWWPSLFDDRRNEPRYRRSSDFSNEDSKQSPTVDPSGLVSETVHAPTEIKPSTNSPISLSEFKVKFNISDTKAPPKKVTARLSGGFINRNSDITDVMEDIIEKKPTEASTSSTVPTTTVKPKVIFPRAKIPRRKTKPPKKTTSPVDTSTESSTSTTTTTVPPPTTTRMYKPKKVVSKSYGRGPFKAFTVLSVSKEVTTTPYESTPYVPVVPKKEEDSAKSPTTEVSQEIVGSPKVTAPESMGENKTLTYMVDPESGIGSWRKWKPKRKRPNTPSVYSQLNTTFKARKRQRDIPDRSREMYVAGLLNRLSAAEGPQQQAPIQSSPRPERQAAAADNRATSRPSKPSPKYILEPDKRRYYYAKV